MCQIEVLARPILAPPSLMLYTPIYTILSETAHHSGVFCIRTLTLKFFVASSSESAT